MMIKNIDKTCNITTGKLDANKAVSDGDYPFFTCAQLPDKIDSFAFDDDVVLVAGNNANGNFHISRFKGKFNAYQRTYVLTAKKGEDIDYVYYSLKLELKRLRERSQGSQTKFLTMPILSSIVINDIEYSDQVAISSILSRIDKKIELNNKINKQLEAIAKLIYDYWFVQFDFPDENGKPYKSSGGKMVFNDVLKREIPDAWNDISLDNIIVKSGTGLNPRSNFKLGEGDNYFITIKNIKNGKINFDDKTDRISDKSLEIIDKRSDLQIGDVLFTSIDPVGNTYFIQEKPKNWNINESVFTLRADEKLLTPEFLLILLSSKEMKVFTKQSSTGSIHKGIRHEVLKDFKLPYGGMPVILSFTKILRPLLERQYMLDTETQKLNELRDWLLPMLMNGQVTVSEERMKSLSKSNN